MCGLGVDVKGQNGQTGRRPQAQAPVATKVSRVLSSLGCMIRHGIGYFIWETMCLIKWPARLFST